MPLVIMCGYPLSGKSYRANELQNFIAKTYPERTVHVIGDHTLGIKINQMYKCSHLEKELRGSLKSSMQRLLDKDTVVILDSMNYIKGFRYELYCASKGCHSTQCVVFCDASKEVVTSRNQKEQGDSSISDDVYEPEIMEGLMMRFEAPNPRNRWDSPLFVLQTTDATPVDAICDALFERKAPPPNQSTQSQPLSSTNFMYELDRVTQDIVTNILEAQKVGGPGDKIQISGAAEQIMLTRTLSLGELQRHKRQFITYTKMHPVEDISKLPGLFVQYLNSALS